MLTDKMRVDNIVLYTQDKQIRGSGIILVSPNKLEIELTTTGGERLPDTGTKVFTKRDYWTLEGVIDNDLPFVCRYVSPGDIPDHF